MSENTSEVSPTFMDQATTKLEPSGNRSFVGKSGISILIAALIFFIVYQNNRLASLSENVSILNQANEEQLKELRQLGNKLEGASAKVGLLESKNRSQSLFEQPKDLGEFITQIGESVVDIYCDIDSSGGTGFSYEIETVLTNYSTALITNYHVIEACWNAESEVEVRMGIDFQKRVSGVIVSVDSTNDLAIVEIDAFVPPLAEATEFAEPGWWSMAIGNPYDSVFDLTLGRFVSTGIIGAVYDDYFNYTTAIINRGNSGGPLVNSFGELIGINTFASKSQADGIWNIAVDSAVLCENLIDCEP
jgi:S1-C subfamily serine protease